MAGFKNSSLNFIAKQNYYEQIILLLKSCSDLMLLSGVKIENHEEKITAYLYHYYLDNNQIVDNIIKGSFPFKFIIESPEKFNKMQNTYDGRADIKVVSSDWFSRKNNDDYYTIECKRVDGTAGLNKKYVKEGVARFILPPIKYQSYHNKNIMFGYVVKTIDIISNIQRIAAIHKSILTLYIAKDIIYIPENSNNNFYMSESEYILDDKQLLLSHIFYDFSRIIA